MIRTPLIASLLLLSSAGAGGRIGGPPNGGALTPQPMVVTTDTDAYCETLSHQIDTYGRDLPAAVVDLRKQGLRLCADGQVRGGINRLRRALVVLHAPGDQDEPDQDR